MFVCSLSVLELSVEFVNFLFQSVERLVAVCHHLVVAVLERLKFANELVELLLLPVVILLQHLQFIISSSHVLLFGFLEFHLEILAALATLLDFLHLFFQETCWRSDSQVCPAAT